MSKSVQRGRKRRSLVGRMRGASKKQSSRSRLLRLETLENRLALAGNVLSGFVYLDASGNGQRETSEAGVPGAMVTLSGTPTSGGTLVRTVIAGNDGSYQFDAVPAGTYSLVERQPTALQDGADSSPLAGAVITNDQLANLVVSGDQTFANNNFGELRIVGGYVTIAWLFASNQDQGEAFRQTVALGERALGDSHLASMISLPSATPATSGAAVPAAVADTYSLNAGATLSIPSATGILANDTDADGDSLTAVLVSTPAHGMLSLNTNGAFTYVPNANYTGSDFFKYAASDGTNVSPIVQVSLLVAGTNGTPTAANDSYAGDQGGSLTVLPATGVLANDIDPEGNSLTAELVTNVTHGTLNLRANGSFDYAPSAGYSGSDSFTYRAKDDANTSNTATVSITVRPTPIAAADTFNANQDQTLTVTVASGVLANDTNPVGGTLTAAVVTSTTHGTLNLNPDGSLTYVPTAGFSGDDTFTYKAVNGTLNSPPATATIRVQRTNLAPTAIANSYVTNEDAPLIVTTGNGVLANDSDGDGDPLHAVIATNPSHGTALLNNDGSFTYTPAANFSGVDTFTYLASDGAASTAATVSITVSEINDPPDAVDDSYVVASNGVLNVAVPGILVNDTDIDTNPVLSVTVDAQPTHGTLTLNTNGSFTYTPTTGFRGVDTFRYLLSDIPPGSDCTLTCGDDGTIIGSDGLVHSDTATVTIHVNSPPTTVVDSYTVVEDGSLDVSVANGVLNNDTDIDGDSLTSALGAAPAHGTITFRLNGSFTYLPTTNFHGSDSFTYTVNDGLQASVAQTVSLTVTSVNDAPQGIADSYSIAGGGLLTIPVAGGVLANDTDADGDSLTATVVTNPAHGTLTLAANGSFTYQSTAGFHGTDTFTYKANDASVSSANVIVSISVNGAPVAVTDSFSTTEDTALSITSANGVLKNDTDPESDALTAIVVTGASHGQVTLQSNGSFQYTPAANFNGVDTFVYKANDGRADSANTTASITVTAVNDPPVAVADSYSAVEDQTLTVAVANGVLQNDTDIDTTQNALTATVTLAPLHGTLSLLANGSFTYTPAANFNGPDSFRYRVSDGQANSAEATVSLTVSGTNDPPQTSADNFSVTQNNTLTVAVANGVLANDSDPDGETLSAAVAVNPTHGTLTFNTNGSFTYTPTANFSGTDSFTYTANDGQVNSSPTTVTIQVQASNSFRVAENAPNGTIVGQVVPTSPVDEIRLYDLVDPTLNVDLQLVIDDHITGSSTARVVLIEYLDLQCPPCGTYHPIIRQLEQQFFDDLLVVRRNLPLTSIHPNAVAAARAAEAADRQGQYENFIDMVYTNQSFWSSAAMPQAFFDSYATDLGLDLTQFHADILDPAISQRVQRDMDSAARMNLRSTPSFFLNGERLASPPASVSGFAALISNELAATNPVFVVDRLTGEVRVSDNAQLNSVTQPTVSLSVRVRDLNGVNLVVPVTVNVVAVGNGEGEAPDPAKLAARFDLAFSDEEDWLGQARTNATGPTLREAL